ncbi:MAG: asparagine synthase-related protein [Vicinamibacterales bacterium]|jgi:asparagine synthase (glutamine-hydrolysing)|nr:asparagine synthase-related protein [Vicinamibacterales bacterium]
MSGIVGLVSLDGAPIDVRLLGRMTDAIAFRGPDHQSTWADGTVGFGHTLLSTTTEPSPDRQPTSLDGRVWITADARIDGRLGLVRRLESRGRTDLRTATDAQLILHAYHVWQDACVEHLLGGFAFAIWDGPGRRLFCARDHFGVKPFYYRRLPGLLVLGNTLECVRRHPETSDRLNELAIADFLLFGIKQDEPATSFDDIQRLPPAHTLIYEAGDVRTRSYWTVPTEGRVRYRRGQDYVDRFNELFDDAVADRVRAGAVGVWASGGLDSTSILATADRVLAERGMPYRLVADTVVYDSLIPHEERRYARIAAEPLHAEISFFAADDFAPLQGWDQPELLPPEPIDEPFLLMRRRQFEQAASHGRVQLHGEGGDEIFRTSYLVDLLFRMRPFELGADLVRTLLGHRCRPGVGLRAALTRWAGREPPMSEYPAWLDRDLARRLDLEARWAHVESLGVRGTHAVRPEAQGYLAWAPWAEWFEAFDPGATGILVESRLPLLDVRLVEYLLAIPPLPWCVDKHLLRVAMQDRLPDPVRLRPKTPLAEDPMDVHLSRGGSALLERFDPTPELAHYVDRSAMPRLTGGPGSHDPWLHLRPFYLNHWLRHRRA